VGSRGWRWLGLIVNGAAMLLYAAIIVGIGALLISTTSRRFIIPNGYKGDVYVIYPTADSGSAEHEAGHIFRIPSDGVLYATTPMTEGLTRDEFYYERGDGVRNRITSIWNTTIERTPENLANDRDTGVFFPHSGTIADSTGCTLQYEAFYVGTKAYLLSGYAPRATNQFAKGHCAGSQR